MEQEYFYIFQSETGERIVEYSSHALPLPIGMKLNLGPITKDYDYVEVVNVEEFPEGERILVKVTVKPTNRHPEFY